MLFVTWDLIQPNIICAFPPLLAYYEELLYGVTCAAQVECVGVRSTQRTIYNNFCTLDFALCCAVEVAKEHHIRELL